jgi:hypothetical protein
MTAVARARVTSSRILAASSASRAQCYEKKQREGDVSKPREGRRKPGKMLLSFFRTNPDGVQDVSDDHGQRFP